MKRPAAVPRLLKQALVKTFYEHDVWGMAAAIAYYAVFSLGPVLVIAMAVAGFILGSGLEESVVQVAEEQLGQDAASAVRGLVAGASDMSSGIIATVIGVITLFFTATTVFVRAKYSLLDIFGGKPPERGMAGQFAVDRLIGFAVVMAVGAILLLSVVAGTAIPVVARAFDLPGGFWQAVNLLVSLALFTALFALVFKLLPYADLAWSSVWGGGLLTAALFVAGNYALSIYLRSFGLSVYGAAGSLLAVLVWANYSAMIFLFGAAFTKVLDDRP